MNVEEHKTVELIQVIRTRMAIRGQGTSDDPQRVVTQYWTLDGKLLAESDPVQHE